jgi:hypothetical protein
VGVYHGDLRVELYTRGGSRIGEYFWEKMAMGREDPPASPADSRALGQNTSLGVVAATVA